MKEVLSNCIKDAVQGDDGYSGTNFNRPDFQRMITLVEQGKVGTVIVKDLSRLGRNYLETGNYTEVIFPEYKVRFIAINDSVDTIRETMSSHRSRTLSTSGMQRTAAGRYGPHSE